MFFSVLISIVLVLFIVNKLLHSTRNVKLLDGVPGPKLLPIVGNGLDFFMGNVKLFYLARMMANQSKKEGIARQVVFHASAVNLYNPEDVEVVLSNNKQITKGLVYYFVHPWLNTGLLTSTGEKWQTRRKILTPAFHFNILRKFCPVFVERSDKMITALKDEIGKPHTEIITFVTNFALDTISETAMGTNLDTSMTYVTKYKQSIYAMGELLVYRFSRVWYHFPQIFNLSGAALQQKKLLSILHNFTMSVIRERRVERKITGNKYEVEGVNGPAIGSKKRMAMLDLLLSAEEEGKIDELGIREEVDTFMFEGHDTTTMGITFCLMCIANNPEVQDRIVAELDEIFADGGDVTVDKLNEMNYLERCIKEALRLYPSVPFIGRQLTEDMQLKKFLIPAGTACNIHIFDIHRNPNIYPDPDKFDPDRFLPENTVNRHPFAYIPFSAGPRNCIGQKFAILEEKAAISAILRNFKLEAVTRPEDIIFCADIVLRTKQPIKVKILPRK